MYAKRQISKKLSGHSNPNVKTFIDYMNQNDDGYWDWMKFVDWTKRKDEFRKEKFSTTFVELAEITEYDKYIKEAKK